MARKRLRPVNPNYERIGGLSPNDPIFQEIKKTLPPHLKKASEWAWFTSAHHIKWLVLNKSFREGITPQSRVLELGAGTGRLGDWLLKKTALRPEGYVAVDQIYGERPEVFMKARVWKQAKRGKIRLLKGNIWKPGPIHRALTGETFDHILIPEGLMEPGWERPPVELEEPRKAGRVFARILVKKLKQGGTLRFSHAQPIFNERASRQVRERNPFKTGFEAGLKHEMDRGHAELVERTIGGWGVSGVIIRRT